MKWLHVVIPVYNAYSYLYETVNSVLNQPYKGIDVVLVDDGSTDGSSKLCDDIARVEKRVTTIHQSNSGVSVARNRGIEYFIKQNIQGSIAFLDADDLWCPNIITDELVEQIREKIKAQVFLLGSISCDSHCKAFSYPLAYKEHICAGGAGAIWPMEGHFCANFYSIELLEKYNIRFIEQLKYSEDKIFRLQCLFLAEQIYFRPEILHIYRENDKSAMRKATEYSPIEYYIPIIEGWVKSDHFINNWERVTGKHTDAGYTLASIYFGDMSAEHYQQWKSWKKLKEVCQNHPYYTLYENMNPKTVSKKQYANQQMHRKHPWLYVMKNQVIGVALFGIKLVLRIKPIRKFRLRRKYPLQSIPHN